MLDEILDAFDQSLTQMGLCLAPSFKSLSFSSVFGLECCERKARNGAKHIGFAQK